MSLYIRLQSSFWHNVKTMRLRARIGDDAFWIPPRLWSYAADNQPDGDFGKYTDAELAMLLGCEKHASSIKLHLTETGFLNADGTIHDWQEWNGYHATFSDRAAKAAAARWGAQKEKKGQRKERKGKEQASSKHCLGNASSINLSAEQSYASLPEWLKASNGMSFALWQTWMATRSKKRAQNTEHAIGLLIRKLDQRKEDAVALIEMAVERGWQGIEWEWFDNSRKSSASKGCAPRREFFQ